MTFSYTDPSSSDGDAIRFLIGDTTTPGEVSDEELAFLLNEAGGNIYVAAEMGVLSLIAKTAGVVDRAVGDLKISLSQKLSQYTSSLANIQRLIDMKNPPYPYVGGRETSERDADQDDTSEIQPPFEIGMHDYPNTPDSGWKGDES